MPRLAPPALGGPVVAGGAPRGAPRTPAKPPRAVPDRPSRRALLLRRARRFLRPAIGLLLLLLLVGGVWSLVRTVQPGSTLASWRERAGAAVGLSVRQVIVEGREKTPEPLLRAALGVSPGDKLLGFSLEAARARVEGLAWVQSATVERRLPGTIVVTLQERRPFAVWQTRGKFVLIDRDGQEVVEQDPAKDATAFVTLPLVVGAGAPENAAPLFALLQNYPVIRSRVVASVRVGERRWNLRLGNGTDVLLPEGAEAPALARLAELQGAEQLLDRPLQFIDMRLPDRLTVRPQPDPRPAAPATPAQPGTARRPT